MQTLTTNKIQVSPKAKIRVDWSDQPENYSKEAKNKILSYFANKYGVPKINIHVNFKPIKIDAKGNEVELNGLSIDNIMDINYQRTLFKTWIEKEKKDVDYDRLIKLDDRVNAELNIDLNESANRKWSIEWIMIDNFLSYGDDNYIDFNKIQGLTVVNSTPSNQSGKTTFSIDSIKFLLFGSTSKTDKNEQIFNKYRDKNELTVKGKLIIDNQDIIIERKLKRSLKKDGTWGVKSDLNYYSIMPDGEEIILNDEHSIKTTNLIKKTIGAEDDFELITLATARNLEDLIDFSSGESGKLLTRFIGLEILELKDEKARSLYNEFAKKMKSNEYNTDTLTTEIEQHRNKIIENVETNKQLDVDLEKAKQEIITLTTEKDEKLSKKQQIDVTITSLNPSKLNQEIETITNKGKEYKTKIDGLKIKIDEIGKVEYDETQYDKLTKDLSKVNIEIGTETAEVRRLNKTIDDLIKGGICQACNRKLDGVDHTEHINEHKSKIGILNANVLKNNGIKVKYDGELAVLNQTKKKVDEKNKLELDRDRCEVEIGSLRNTITEKMNDLKKYNLNLSSIEFNKTIDSEVSIIKTKLVVCETTKDNLIKKIEAVKTDISNNNANIENKLKIIEQIKIEGEVEKIYKIYIEMIGKKGISKLVLRSVLPIINSEVQRLLEDACDFDVEIYMDDKNEVQFLIIVDDVQKLLKSGSGLERTASALALRCVLGKMSRLPMPNFVTFDEVLGKVANENIEGMKPLFDKISKLYDIVFLITHNDLVKDWSKNIITVVKNNNISRISIK